MTTPLSCELQLWRDNLLLRYRTENPLCPTLRLRPLDKHEIARVPTYSKPTCASNNSVEIRLFSLFGD